jgi:hypothetical protein
MALVAILDVRVLADGRIGALIELDDPSYLPERRKVQFFTFVEEGGRYLVDDFVSDLEDQFSAADGLPGPPSDSSANTPAVATPRVEGWSQES